MDLVASKILKKFLKTFIESCSDWGTGDDVDITPSQGIVTLHDIAFIKDVFKEMVFLPSQLDVETATCSSIDVVVPWTQLYKKPIILRLGEVVVEAKDMSIDETTRRRKVRKPKKPKKKKSRELIDTILVELTLFKLVLKIGPSTLHLVIQGGETYFADEQFHKIKKIPEEKACDGIVYSYRFLQVNSLTLTFVNGERSANLCDGMEVVGRVTTQRDHDSYALLDTSVVVDLSTISLNLSMDDYINLVSYFQTLFGIATESAIIDVVNAAPSTSATPTPVLTPESDSPHRLPSMTQSQPIPTTKMSRPQSLSNSPITSSPSNKFMKPRPNSRLGSILTVETIGEKEAKKQEKAEKKAEKKLLKEEKKGDARLQFQIHTNEGLCWLIGETVVTFVPAYGGRIKEGWYGFDIKTIEGLYTHGEEIKRLIWGLEEDATQKTLSSRISTTWNRNILVGTKLTGELRFVGITMEFEMLKNLIEFLKVTVIDKISELSVDVLSIKEQIAKTIEDVKEKWEDALDILGLTSALDLLKRVGVDFTLYGCRFEGPFPDNGGNFVVEVDDVTITNEPHWTSLSVEKKVEKQLKHKLSIAPMTTPKSIRLNIALGTFSVAFF
ncbi:Chorein N-terminal domain-containing protein [Entamoeba marina]